MAEVFEYELRGKDTSFGNTVKNAVKVVGELKSAGAQVLSSFTGGLIGGGIAQSLVSAVGLVRDLIREARDLANQADKLDITRRNLKGAQRIGEALDIGEAIPQGIEAAKQARSDLRKNETEAVKAFERLGITLAEINQLSPDKVFARVADAFKGVEPTDERRYAAQVILGKQVADALVPYFVGGQSSELRAQMGMDPQLRLNFGNLPGLGREAMAFKDPEVRKRYRADLEPLSTFGLDAEEKVRRMNESVQELRDRNNRANLSAEKQLLDITEKRLKKQREAESETDPKRKVQLEMDIEQLRAQGIAVKAGMTRSGIPGISRDMDQMARAGFFRGGAPDIATDTMRKQLAEMQRIAALLKTLPAGIAREW